MKNILLISILSTAMPLMADTLFSFIGINAAYQQIKMDGTYSTDDTTHTDLALRIGAQTRKWRASIALENGNKYKAFEVDLDAIPFDELFGTPKIRPYIGVSATLLNYTNPSLPDTDGYGFGGNIGVILYAGERVDVDIAYRYSTINRIKGVDSMQGVRLGIHYFY